MINNTLIKCNYINSKSTIWWALIQRNCNEIRSQIAVVKQEQNEVRTKKLRKHLINLYILFKSNVIQQKKDRK